MNCLLYTSTQPSVQGVMYINQLFHLEDVIKAKYTSFDAIKKARLEKEKPVPTFPWPLSEWFLPCNHFFQAAQTFPLRLLR